MLKQGYKELTLNLLQKTPEVGHLLVRLHDKHMLYSMTEEGRPESRAELTNIMADLLAIELTPTETELITDVLMGVMRQAEIDLKRAVAERLSVMKNVPLRLIVHLANEPVSVSEPILTKSSDLDEYDLMYIIKSHTADHWRMIAKRAQISAAIINELADTKDLRTAVNLTKNKNIKLTPHAINVFADMAEGSQALAKPLVLREELPEGIAKKLYDFVGRELKAEISKKFPTEDLIEFNEVVDDIVFEVTTIKDDLDVLSPTQAMIAAAEKMMQLETLKPRVMIDNLRRGQISSFIAMFSVYSGLPIKTVIEMLNQKTGQGLAVACKAIGIQKPEYINIYLLTARLRGEKIIDQGNLALALTYYDTIKEHVARKILNQSRH